MFDAVSRFWTVVVAVATAFAALTASAVFAAVGFDNWNFQTMGISVIWWKLHIICQVSEEETKLSDRKQVK